MSYVAQYISEDRSEIVESRDGVLWIDAPLPRRLHRCTVQTRGWYGYFNWLERCPCGAVRYDNGRWRERNSRRKEVR